MLVAKDKGLLELTERKSYELDNILAGTSIVCLPPTESEYGLYAVYSKSGQNCYPYHGIFTSLEDATLFGRQLEKTVNSVECRTKCSSGWEDKKLECNASTNYCHTDIDSSGCAPLVNNNVKCGRIEWDSSATLETASTSLSASGNLYCGNLSAPTYFTSFVNNKVSFMLNIKDAAELFRTTSVLINSGYKITLMTGSGEDGYVLTYSPSDLTCSIVG